MFNELDLLSVNTIRLLSLDQVENAQTGHSGAPLGQAPMAHALWTKHLNINPNNPEWFNRDRFVLSSGHASPMIYSLLHLAGFDVSLEDLKEFRHFDTKTPGHPEVTHTPGVEATTGPLGQGVANAVGMAMAEAHLAATYNKENHEVVDHYTYVIAGDGDLQEGVSQEASSLAGHLKLGKLIMLYDSNEVQLDGPTSKAFSENVAQRYEAYGWHYIYVEDGADLDQINEAIEEAKKVTDKPSIIEIRTIIGFGMPLAGTAATHSDPIGPEGVAHVRNKYKWEIEEEFYVPEDVKELYKQNVLDRGSKKEEEWQQVFSNYKQAYPELAADLELAISGELPENWDSEIPKYSVGDNESSRDTSSKILNAIAKNVHSLWGGSADLATSNRSMIEGSGDFLPGSYEGKNIWYGVREFAMGAILNGITLHGGTKSYAATFFVFSDYLRPAIRLAALSELPNIYIFTHDSVILGFDGATHEPVEHFASYRAMPNLTTFRPADANETIAAWEYAMKSKTRPTILALSRQGLPVLKSTGELASENVSKGAYVISAVDNPEGIIIATGSEVSLAIEAQKALKDEGKNVSVVSMPSMDLFEEQSDEYKESVLPADIKKRLVVEAGSSLGWAKYFGDGGTSISIDTFGICGPGEEVMEHFGYSVENVVSTYNKL